ncbi:MAG: hypothetical protein AB7P17_14960 [Nitrospirales bacterium]|nr:hypothetical protein [Nitrospirales bacterium]
MKAWQRHKPLRDLCQILKFALYLFAFTPLLVACGTHSKYTPAITSDVPPHPEIEKSNSIPLKIRFIKLIDVSSAEDKEDGWLYGSGWSVTSPERLNGNLETVLTEAIANNLRFHNIFDTIVTDHSDEPIVLEGKIHRFYQRREQYLWGLCCGLLGLLLPFPLMKEEGEVDIELTLSISDHTRIKSYRGKSSFVERSNAYDGRSWESYDNSPAKFLDNAFDDSIRQIRQAMIQDRDMIAQQISTQKLP